MTTRTRYFVIASLLVLGVGLGTGLVAYYVGFPDQRVRAPGRPGRARVRPADATARRLRRRPRDHDLGAPPEAPPRPADAGRRPARIREPDRHQHRNRHRPRRRLPGARLATARHHGRRHGPRPRPVRRGEDRSADARARRARRGLQGQAPHRRDRRARRTSTGDTVVGTDPRASPWRSSSPASWPSAARS